MPAWLTIAVGFAGAFVGGFIVFLLAVLFGGGEEAAAPPPGAGQELTDEEAAIFGLMGFVVLFMVAVVGATILLVLHRKLIQKRPLTGPEAQRPPLRTRGLRRVVTRRPHRYVEETADPQAGWAPDQLQKLVLLRDAGKIDADEFERRKAALVERL